ncbi:MAG: anaerobic ribonucleoside-triphosphate reductase activating protein [Lachnospiraceae bacterium]|nr:anaerobic ribonucleoside-triphosphate reductase activating protein [Lachnospiraceae bacterium]
MRIDGLAKLTLLDYPEHLACTLFFAGCDFRCPFCHNASLVTHPKKEPAFKEEDILAFLKKRQGTLEGVCITGGEASLQPDLIPFIEKVKALGFLVKLDTNGYHPDVLRTLYQKHLLDYVAMDIKNSLPLYEKTAGLSGLDLSKITDSVALIRTSDIPYEFRTTVVRELHTKDSFLQIGDWLHGSSRYYLQAFKDSDDLIGGPFTGYEKETLLNFITLLKPHFEEIGLRGMD